MKNPLVSATTVTPQRIVPVTRIRHGRGDCESSIAGAGECGPFGDWWRPKIPAGDRGADPKPRASGLDSLLFDSCKFAARGIPSQPWRSAKRRAEKCGIFRRRYARVEGRIARERVGGVSSAKQPTMSFATCESATTFAAGRNGLMNAKSGKPESRCWDISTTQAPVLPGQRSAMVGGGSMDGMFAIAAVRMGYRVGVSAAVATKRPSMWRRSPFLRAAGDHSAIENFFAPAMRCDHVGSLETFHSRRFRFAKKRTDLPDANVLGDCPRSIAREKTNAP